MSGLGKKSIIRMFGGGESSEVIEQKKNALQPVISRSGGLKRLVKNTDWKYLIEVIAEVRGLIIQQGKLTNDKEKRYGVFEALNAIDGINAEIIRTINEGEKALQQYNDLQSKLEKMHSESA